MTIRGFVNNYNTTSIKYIQQSKVRDAGGLIVYNTLHIIIADDLDQ